MLARAILLQRVLIAVLFLCLGLCVTHLEAYGADNKIDVPTGAKAEISGSSVRIVGDGRVGGTFNCYCPGGDGACVLSQGPGAMYCSQKAGGKTCTTGCAFTTVLGATPARAPSAASGAASRAGATTK